jgi:hypothetical protein
LGELMRVYYGKIILGGESEESSGTFPNNFILNGQYPDDISDERK